MTDQLGPIRETHRRMYLEGLRTYFQYAFQDDLNDDPHTPTNGVTFEAIQSASDTRQLIYLIETYYQDVGKSDYTPIVRNTLLGPFWVHGFLDCDREYREQAMYRMYLEGLRCYFRNAFIHDIRENDSAITRRGITLGMIVHAESVHELVELIDQYYESPDYEDHEMMVRSTLLSPFLPLFDLDEFRPTRRLPENEYEEPA